jgi:hypothetical protein
VDQAVFLIGSNILVGEARAFILAAKIGRDFYWLIDRGRNVPA